MFPSLQEFIADKEGYLFSTGYKVGGVTKKWPAHYITGENKVTEITATGQVLSNEIENIEQFEAPRPLELYKPPFLLIHPKAGQLNFPVALVEEYKNEYLVFDRKFIAIKVMIQTYKSLNPSTKELVKSIQNFITFGLL